MTTHCGRVNGMSFMWFLTCLQPEPSDPHPSMANGQFEGKPPAWLLESDLS